MDNAARGFHPLDPAGAQIALIAHTVAVLHVPVDHVGERYKAAVRVVGKSGDIFVGVVATEMVEHEKWVEVA